MDSRAFFGLQQSHNPYRWSFEITRDLCAGGEFLFGGCALGAAISALEGTTGREMVWSTAQYLSFAKPGGVLDIDVQVHVVGHQITQARAVCHVGNREILTVTAALGHRDLDLEGQWEQMPAAPPPLECPERRWPGFDPTSISGRLDERLVKGRPWSDFPGPEGDGQTLVWARIPEVVDGVDAAALAVLGDMVPSGVGQALGVRTSVNSLDNTLRVVKLVPTEWVLLDIRMHAVSRGFGHGLLHMFAEDGTLMATASQSCIVRLPKD